MFLSPVKKNVKPFAFDQLEQRTVFDAAPPHSDDGLNLTPGQGSRQLERYVLIEQNLQSCA